MSQQKEVYRVHFRELEKLDFMAYEENSPKIKAPKFLFILYEILPKSILNKALRFQTTWEGDTLNVSNSKITRYTILYQNNLVSSIEIMSFYPLMPYNTSEVFFLTLSNIAIHAINRHSLKTYKRVK